MSNKGEKYITIEGARVNNLKNISLKIPRGKLTVITGLSAAYLEMGDKVYSTIPVGYSKGEIEVSVSMYDDGTLITSYSVNEENDIVWNV